MRHIQGQTQRGWPFYHVSLLVMDITRDYVMEKLGIHSEVIDYYHNNLE